MVARCRVKVVTRRPVGRDAAALPRRAGGDRRAGGGRSPGGVRADGAASPSSRRGRTCCRMWRDGRRRCRGTRVWEVLPCVPRRSRWRRSPPLRRRPTGRSARPASTAPSSCTAAATCPTPSGRRSSKSAAATRPSSSSSRPPAATGDADAPTAPRPVEGRKPASAVVLHTRSRKTADDPEFARARCTRPPASGSPAETQEPARRGLPRHGVEKEVTAVLKRGGVVGGTASGGCRALMIAGGTKEAKMRPASTCSRGP